MDCFKQILGLPSIAGMNPVPGDAFFDKSLKFDVSFHWDPKEKLGGLVASGSVR